MDIEDIYELLLEHFGWEPTESQEVVLEELAGFLADDNDQSLFLLKGFAGTGKTTLVNTLVKTLKALSQKVVLLAPTGRAAKVMTTYTAQRAFTIHKYIYQAIDEQGMFSFSLKDNKASDTLFIVDEASMIGEESVFGQGSLLSDLMEFVYVGDNCRLLIIGDTAQLPPIHTPLSPALDSDRLSFVYHKEVIEGVLTDVVRQGRKSGILYNATRLRKRIETFKDNFRMRITPFKDMVLLENASEVQDALLEAYEESGVEETCFIVRANKRAVEDNQQIRHQNDGQVIDGTQVFHDLYPAARTDHADDAVITDQIHHHCRGKYHPAVKGDRFDSLTIDRQQSEEGGERKRDNQDADKEFERQHDGSQAHRHVGDGLLFKPFGDAQDIVKQLAKKDKTGEYRQE